MKLSEPGEGILVSVENITPFGIWLFVKDKEYFLNYDVLNSDFTVELGQKKKITMHNTPDESDWSVTLADTGNNALKGARLRRIEKYITEDIFMVTYGDGVGDINIKKLLYFHSQKY